ncbi:helix-turn-helix domain-containing protein [Undibacterium sp. SXout7W]|uniref:helix-turn-helix domain-containing protein n=1 Tax=Undibacterium sp. SXout7W TaxID=3413049 RepID=UPI003BF1AA46
MRENTIPLDTETNDALDLRLALRLASLRADRGLSLDDLAQASGISRATLSRIERGDTSPSASLLSKLCSVYGISMSRLLADVEAQTPGLIALEAQALWVDPASGFLRRTVSAPARDFQIELVEITLPAGAMVNYDAPTVHGTEQHIWMCEGQLEIALEGKTYRLERGDCLRFHMRGAARFVCPGSSPARYLCVSLQP